MKYSSILKGLVFTVALFMFVSEAAAQGLPVRTRSLQLIDPSGAGVVTQVAASPTVNYSVVWPGASAWPAVAPPAGTQYFLRSQTGTTTLSNLTWFQVNGDLVDNNAGSGLAGQVTYWADDNSITGEAGFLWSALTNTLTIGQTGETAEIRFTNGTFASTLVTSNVTTDVEYRLPTVPAGNVNIPVSGNLPSILVDDQILLSNLDGTATWTDNPFAGVQRGVASPLTAGAYTHTVTLPVAAVIDANDVIIITSYDINATPNGNILSVTARLGATFQVNASGPFTNTEAISWLFIPIP